MIIIISESHENASTVVKLEFKQRTIGPLIRLVHPASKAMSTRYIDERGNANATRKKIAPVFRETEFGILGAGPLAAPQ